MKKLLIVFCCAFTAVTLFCSFNPIEREGNRFFSMGAGYYQVNKVTCDSKNYIVVVSNHGVAICPESK